MAKAVVDGEKCLQCIACEAVSACPARAIFRLEGSTLIEATYCHGCGACIGECVGGAISLG